MVFTLLGLKKIQLNIYFHNQTLVISNSTYQQMINVGPNGVCRNFAGNWLIVPQEATMSSYARNRDLTTEMQIGIF